MYVETSHKLAKMCAQFAWGDDLCGRLRSAVVARTNAFLSSKVAINEPDRHLIPTKTQCEARSASSSFTF